MTPHLDDLVQRLKNAVEGECEGLAITDEQAASILDYIGVAALRARVAELEARATLQAGMSAETLQARVQPWMMACFGPEISADRVERGDRLLEEVFELLQSGGYDPARVVALRDYVWSREPGEPFQEVGGVEITLAAYCLAHGLDKHEAGEAELARIWTKVDKIRAKQAAKPVGSALPVAFATPPDMLEGIRVELDLLRMAVDASDPKAEIKLRVKDLIASLAALSGKGGSNG